MEKVCGIYMIKNKVNGKMYIGQSVDIHARVKKHKSTAFNESIKNHQYDKPLYRAIRKYGVDNFSFKIIKECSKEDLHYYESYYIDLYFSADKRYGYNIRDSMQFVGTYNGKLNRYDVYNIIKDLKDINLLKTEIAQKYGVSRQTISAINRGTVYCLSHEDYPIRDDKYNDFYINRQRKEVVYDKCEVCGKDIIAKGNIKFCSNICHIRYRDELSMRPSKEDLVSNLKDIPNYTKLGNLYNVSGNCVKKWCVEYGIPSNNSFWRKLYEDSKGYKYESFLNYIEYKKNNRNNHDYVVNNYYKHTKYDFVHKLKIISEGNYKVIEKLYKFN